MDILAIIPARGGSKGVPQKNLRPVGGKPLIVWTCEAARRVSALSRIVVSTDDPLLAGIAKEAGVEVPFLRPQALATDTASAVDVVFHCLEWFREKESWKPTAVLLLQPTSPLRTFQDIQAAIHLFYAKKAQAVVSVTPTSHPAEWLKKIDEEGRLSPRFDSSSSPERRQLAPATFELNGAIYLIETKTLFAEKTFCPSGSYAYVMPRERSLDIDTPWDLSLADTILCEHKH